MSNSIPPNPIHPHTPTVPTTTLIFRLHHKDSNQLHNTLPYTTLTSTHCQPSSGPYSLRIGRKFVHQSLSHTEVLLSISIKHGSLGPSRSSLQSEGVKEANKATIVISSSLGLSLRDYIRVPPQSQRFTAASPPGMAHNLSNHMSTCNTTTTTATTPIGTQD